MIRINDNISMDMERKIHSKASEEYAMSFFPMAMILYGTVGFLLNIEERGFLLNQIMNLKSI